MTVWTVNGRNYRIITNGTKFRIERQGRFFRKRWHLLYDDDYVPRPLEWDSLHLAEFYLKTELRKIQQVNVWTPVED